MPADASVRMNLTYPHAMPVSNEQSRSQKVTVAGQLVATDPGTGQMVYVSHHPTLANVQQLVCYVEEIYFHFEEAPYP